MIDALNLSLESWDIDEIKLKFNKLDEVKVDLIEDSDIDEVQIDLENLGEDSEKVRITFFRALLIFINSMGEYLFRHDAKKKQCSQVQISWNYVNMSCAAEREAGENMKRVLKAMDKSETKFYTYFLRK